MDTQAACDSLIPIPSHRITYSMKSLIKFFIVGILFGIVMTKSEAVSWYRIQEMFLFESFHMYGIIGTAVVLGTIGTAAIKHYRIKDYTGSPIMFHPKAPSVPRYLFGGIIFGLGWALIGACPGPMYTLLGHGFLLMLPVIAGAFLGTLAYGILRPKLPH